MEPSNRFALGVATSGILTLLMTAVPADPAGTAAAEDYRSFSRFTDPGELSSLLEDLPDDVFGICEIAARQTVHHNLLPHLGVPREQWGDMARVWPPRVPDLLETLADRPPGTLTVDRPIEERIIGACMLESHLLAGMLRSRAVPVRIRAGYFKDVRGDEDHVVQFWENVSRAKGREPELLEQDPERWKEVFNQLTRKQVAVNRHIEHWICEYWDEGADSWRLIDANDTFLRASAGLDVAYHLPREHFEYAHEAWARMRSDPEYDPDQHKEWPLDGRSHIRAQMLMDYFNLLNHDVAGEGQPTPDEREFIKKRTYEELSPRELEELDALAALLSRDPGREELVAFYREVETIRLAGAEADPYSFVFTGSSR